MNRYQKACINDIYGTGNPDFIDNADMFYKTHNVIKNGIELSSKISPINNVHNISYTYINYESSFDLIPKPYQYKENFSFYPLMSIPETLFINNNYKLLSAKDIDYENAYLKYANEQISEFRNPISYTDVYIDDETKLPVVSNQTTDSYIFNREITPYINNTYDLLNIVDYLFNRISCFYFLLEKIKNQHSLLDIK